MDNKEYSLNLLRLAGVFYYNSPEEALECNDDAEASQTLNMNDTFGWAVAWGVYVHDNELIEVANMYKMYGDCGLMYWVSRKNNDCRSEFYDVNRKIDFVRKEEEIRSLHKTYSELAYAKHVYTLGEIGE